MAPVFILVALAASLPTTSLESVCEGAKVGSLPEDQASAFQVCVQDEKAARDELQKKWGHFSVSMRETCAEPAGVMFSYVELLTCLEMQPGSDLDEIPIPRLEPLTPMSDDTSPGQSKRR
jgi:hypothetical protein